MAYEIIPEYNLGSFSSPNPSNWGLLKWLIVDLMGDRIPGSKKLNRYGVGNHAVVHFCEASAPVGCVFFATKNLQLFFVGFS